MARAILRDRKLGWIRSFLTRLLSRHALGAYGNSAAVSASASSSHSKTFAKGVVSGSAAGAGPRLVLFVVELDVPEALSSEVGICGDGAPSSGGREERRFLASVSDIGVLTFSSFPRAGVAAVAASTAAVARIFSPERTPAGAASSERGC